jgi:hypothetical protein
MEKNTVFFSFASPPPCVDELAEKFQ